MTQLLDIPRPAAIGKGELVSLITITFDAVNAEDQGFLVQFASVSWGKLHAFINHFI
jgi:hypothetical protein